MYTCHNALHMPPPPCYLISINTLPSYSKNTAFCATFPFIIGLIPFVIEHTSCARFWYICRRITLYTTQHIYTWTILSWHRPIPTCQHRTRKTMYAGSCTSQCHTLCYYTAQRSVSVVKRENGSYQLSSRYEFSVVSRHRRGRIKRCLACVEQEARLAGKMSAYTLEKRCSGASFGYIR